MEIAAKQKVCRCKARQASRVSHMNNPCMSSKGVNPSPLLGDISKYSSLIFIESRGTFLCHSCRMLASQWFFWCLSCGDSKKIYSTGTEWASVHSSVTLPGVADVPIQGCEKHLSRGRSRTIAFLGGQTHSEETICEDLFKNVLIIVVLKHNQ